MCTADLKSFFAELLRDMVGSGDTNFSLISHGNGLIQKKYCFRIQYKTADICLRTNKVPDPGGSDQGDKLPTRNCFSYR